MTNAFQSIYEFLGGQPYQPHGYCLLWSPQLVATHVTADTFIALSYFSIPFGLVYFARRRKDLAYRWLFFMFALFIIGCGTTHIMDIWTLWFPNYWTDGIIRHITAVASVSTAVALWLLIPQALKLPSPRQLQDVNAALLSEVAERQKAEEELRRVNEQLSMRSLELERLNTELEAFSYTISHDLRAPLRGIDGFTQALQEDYGGTLDETGNRYLTRVRTAAGRMGELIDDLLELSRISRSEPNRKPLDLSRLAGEVVNNLQERDPHRQASVIIQPGLEATADERLLRVVLENLIGNAWKYSANNPNACIEVGSTTPAEGETIFVRDNGVGFDPQYAGRLFTPFQRLHDASEFEGTGVGLATVQRIIHRHGGRVWAESQVGEGATFYFTLPPNAALP